MDLTLTLTMVLALAGLLLLMLGYGLRARRVGPVLMWVGVFLLLGLIGQYVLVALG